MALLIAPYRGRDYIWHTTRNAVVRVPWVRYSLHISVIKRIPTESHK